MYRSASVIDRLGINTPKSLTSCTYLFDRIMCFLHVVEAEFSCLALDLKGATGANLSWDFSQEKAGAFTYMPLIEVWPPYHSFKATSLGRVALYAP